jgi:hypothetical protein
MVDWRCLHAAHSPPTEILLVVTEFSLLETNHVTELVVAHAEARECARQCPDDALAALLLLGRDGIGSDRSPDAIRCYNHQSAGDRARSCRLNRARRESERSS